MAQNPFELCAEGGIFRQPVRQLFGGRRISLRLRTRLLDCAEDGTLRQRRMGLRPRTHSIIVPRAGFEPARPLQDTGF